MKNAKYSFQIYKEVNGTEKEFTVSLYPCNPRSLRKLLNKNMPWIEVKEYDEASGKMKSVNKYCIDDKEVQGIGWAEKMRPELKQFFEDEKCDCPCPEGVTFDDIMDMITLTDNILSTFIYGDKDRGIDGYFQKCNESAVKFS